MKKKIKKYFLEKKLKKYFFLKKKKMSPKVKPRHGPRSRSTWLKKKRDINKLRKIWSGWPERAHDRYHLSSRPPSLVTGFRGQRKPWNKERKKQKIPNAKVSPERRESCQEERNVDPFWTSHLEDRRAERWPGRTHKSAAKPNCIDHSRALVFDGKAGRDLPDRPPTFRSGQKDPDDSGRTC